MVYDNTPGVYEGLHDPETVARAVGRVPWQLLARVLRPP